MAAQTAAVIRAMSCSALAQSSASGAAASMSFGRAGLALRRTGLSSLSSWSHSSLRLPLVAVNPPLQRSYAQAPKVVAASQWKPEGPGGFEVEIDSNSEFPRPSSVPWAKEIANTVHLVGNVGRDMEIKYLDTGKVVAKSSLAVLKNSLKKEEPPSWYGLVNWIWVFCLGRTRC